MATLTAEQREALATELQDVKDARAPLEAFIAPIEKALSQLDDMEYSVLQRYGIDGEITTCEHCEALIVPGDNYARYTDGPICCEACAPTYADSLAQQRETAKDEQADPDDRAEAQACVAQLEAMTPEQLAQKILSVWE